METITRLFSAASGSGDCIGNVPSADELVKLIESTLPRMTDHQRILSQTRYEPRVKVYPPTDPSGVPMMYLHAHLGMLHKHIDTICTSNPAEVALRILYGLGEFTSIAASEFTCEYVWSTGIASESGYKTHSITDELAIITWSIACRTMIEAIKETISSPAQEDREFHSNAGAISKFTEAARYFESHSLLGKKAGYSRYFGPTGQPPPHFARGYMGGAFSLVCKAFHQLCQAETMRTISKDRKEIVYHMHFYFGYMDKATSLMESAHRRDSADPALRTHFLTIQRAAALNWYEFYLAVTQYFDDPSNTAWAFDEMNAVIGNTTQPESYAYMRRMRDELEKKGSIMATGSVLRNLRYVYNTKITTRRRIPHKVYHDEPPL
jgi:hypothetical protein